MCGITGYFQGTYHNKDDQNSILERMSSAISYRGPDDSGRWSDTGTGIALAHRRLSILDLSPAGHQPMVSPSGRYVITYNGEIYNHLELRALLCEPSWRGHSDTETLLVCIENWGIEETLKKSIGMFAFALWDRELRCLTLARDRVGEKPLYYGWQGKTFMFASELKALKKHPDFVGEIDRDSLILYLRHGYINAPYSIYKNIKKLEPGTYITITEANGAGFFPEPKVFWSFEDLIQKSSQEKYHDSFKNAANNLEQILLDVIKGQMLSDVPLGAFLSGGIDSSLIVSLMQKLSSSPIKTFTIGFNEKTYNEAQFAKKVALHLGTDHTEIYVSDQDAISVIPSLPNIYDEPFGDSSAIPTYLVSKLARQYVTVSLSGDGGDELFGGYSRYFTGDQTWRIIQNVPLKLRQLLSPIAFIFASKSIFPVLSPISKFLRYREGSSISVRFETLGRALNCNSFRDYYHNQVSQWRDPKLVVLNAIEPFTTLSKACLPNSFASFFEYMMYADCKTYLPGDILTKVDRAGMSVGIESRIPFLDPRVIEFSWKLCLNHKVQNGNGKYILRQILNKYVPVELIERPKMGFGVPIDHWIRGPFKEWAEDLLSEHSIKSQGFFNYKPIQERLNEHLSLKHNWKDSLWTILSFQAWLANK